MSLACPSCGFLTVDEEYYGTYNICCVCGWEDDQVQLANPCSRGGANSESLYESQLKALEKWPMTVIEFRGSVRSQKWRPLLPAEVEKYQSLAKEQPWTNHGILNESETYWEKHS